MHVNMGRSVLTTSFGTTASARESRPITSRLVLQSSAACTSNSPKPARNCRPDVAQAVNGWYEVAKTELNYLFASGGRRSACS